MKDLIKIKCVIISLFIISSCTSKQKCTSPPCPTDGTISYSIEDDPNEASYRIECDKDVICVCFCADIPDHLQSELWTANLLNGNTPIQTIIGQNVGNVWEDDIPVDAEIYGSSLSNLRIEVFIEGEADSRILSEEFSWSCK